MSTIQMIIIFIMVMGIIATMIFLVIIINVQKYKWAALAYSFIFDHKTYKAYKQIKASKKSLPIYTMWSVNMSINTPYYVYDYTVWTDSKKIVISRFYKPLIEDIILTSTLN